MRVLIFILAFTSNIAFADCWYNGVIYPTGSQVNGLTCSVDGSWKG